MDNKYVIAFLFWPAVVLLCAGINMLVTWTFSWSELIFDYFIGVLAGWFLFSGTQANPDSASSFFFIFSHGFFAFLWWAAGSFRAMFSKPENFFWAMAGIRLGATLWCALWDRLAVSLTATFAPGPFLLSLLILAPVKFCFAWVTSAFGFVIWLAGLVKAIGSTGRVGFAGGVLFDEFAPGAGAYKATTLGFTVHTWLGNIPFRHELYHTRQYIYMCDWLVPFWLVGMLWGVISAAATGTAISTAVAFKADTTREIGNPIEVAAYHI